MNALTVTKNTALAAIITAVFMSAPAMAAEGGKCRTDIAYNSVVPLDATPENFEGNGQEMRQLVHASHRQYVQPLHYTPVLSASQNWLFSLCI